MAGGCSESSTKPEERPPDEGSLLLSRLSVSVVPGATETIDVCAIGSTGAPDTCFVYCADASVASVSMSDSTIQITGVAYGSTSVTVTTGCGLHRTVPVQVYSPFILDVGELLVTYVDEFSLVWADHGSGAPNDVAFYQPALPDGFRALGSLGVPNWSDPDGNYAMMVVQAKDGSDALAEPTGYERIWYFIDGFPPRFLVTVWNPIPPPGYVAMGTVAIQPSDPQNPLEPPPLDLVVCVREDLTVDGEAGAYIWHDEDTGMPQDLGCWRIDQPDAGPHDYCYLTTGTFVGWNSWSPPAYHELLHVLKVNLPMLAESPYQLYQPRLAGYEEPPLESPPVMARAMLVPCTIVNDLQYAENLRWRIANSPFYRLERHVFYKRLYHNHNASSQPQTNLVRIISGVTTTESERFWSETSISVSVEAGISIEAFSGKVSTTVTRSFGYESQTSVAELQQREIETSVNTAPGTAAACWQKYNRYVLLRHNGTRLEEVYAWEFGIDSYVVDDYPDE
jgi:hypothetical protein